MKYTIPDKVREGACCMLSGSTMLVCLGKNEKNGLLNVDNGSWSYLEDMIIKDRFPSGMLYIIKDNKLKKNTELSQIEKIEEDNISTTIIMNDKDSLKSSQYSIEAGEVSILNKTNNRIID